MKIRFLGTGTSQGIPVIGCTCDVCLSEDPHDKRLRVAILLSQNNTNIVVDVGPDFRQQMLQANAAQLDAVLLTHEHNDHTAGLDDLRSFNFRQGFDMPIFTAQRVVEDLKQRFAYTFSETRYPGAPRFDCKIIDENSFFAVNDLEIQCVGIQHGDLPILGFRFGDVAYCTDVKSINSKELKKLKNLNVLILSALHRFEHHSHLNLAEAIELIKYLKPKQTYLTHISHHFGKAEEIKPELPENVKLAYDGLEIFV